MLFGVSATYIDTVWEDIKPFIEQAMPYAHGKYSIDDIHQGLLDRQMQLWMTESSIGITQIIDFPQSRRAVIFLVSGSLDCLQHEAIIAQWAREQGCDALECWGRPGWERVLKDWQKIQVVLEKKL